MRWLTRFGLVAVGALAVSPTQARAEVRLIIPEGIRNMIVQQHVAEAERLVRWITSGGRQAEPSTIIVASSEPTLGAAPVDPLHVAASAALPQLLKGSATEHRWELIGLPSSAVSTALIGINAVAAAKVRSGPAVSVSLPETGRKTIPAKIICQ